MNGETEKEIRNGKAVVRDQADRKAEFLFVEFLYVS